MSSTKASAITSMSCSNVLLQDALRVLRAGQFFAKTVQPKPTVDALQQDAAGFLVAVDYEHVLGAAPACRDAASRPAGPPPTTTTS